MEARIAELAARQHGLITRAQLLALGLGSAAITYRLSSARLWPVQRGVYRMGPLVSPRMREMAAVLACGRGAAISHGSAGRLWQLLPLAPESVPIDILVPTRDRHRRPGVRGHRSAPLAPGEVSTFEGIPVTTPARTLLDLAAELGARELEQALARAERLGVASREEVLALVARHPGKRGVWALLALLRASAAAPLTRSEAEERFLELVRRARLPNPEANVPVRGYEVDFLWRRERLAVEVDGFAFHGSAAQFERDRRRDAELSAAGVQVMRVTWRQISSDSVAMLVRLAQTLARCSPGGHPH